MDRLSASSRRANSLRAGSRRCSTGTRRADPGAVPRCGGPRTELGTATVPRPPRGPSVEGAGERVDGGSTVLKRPDPSRLTGVPEFVVDRGGAYGFMPGLRALRGLADLDPEFAGRY